MYLSNSRVYSNKGLTFYENDLLLDDYIHSGDMILSFDAEYLNPGIGIAILKNINDYIYKSNENFLFKIGDKNAGVYYRLGDYKKTIEEFVTNISTCGTINFKMIKTDRNIQIFCNNIKIIDYTIQKTLDSFFIGIYSSKYNTIKNLQIISSIPKLWSVNMDSTNGGYVKFAKNKFTITDSYIDAELEHYGIELQEGYYYLTYDKSEKCDIKAFLYKESDEIMSEKDNILNDSGGFEIRSNEYGVTRLILKFVGKNGSISNIKISKNLYDKYVPSKGLIGSIDHSYIDIMTRDIKKVEFLFTINNTNNNDKSFIAKSDTSNQSITAANLYIKQGIKYKLTYDKNLGNIQTFIDNTINTEKVIQEPINKVTFFNNINTSIDYIKIYKNNGDIIDGIQKEETVKYIPYGINSPILICYNNENGDYSPFDISSSYRIYNNIYKFTNIEREYFTDKNSIVLSKNCDNNLVVRGIPPYSKCDFTKLYNIAIDNDNDISEFSKDAVDIHDFIYDSDTNEVIIQDKGEYDFIIIDYECRNSYAINYIPEIMSYEVLISSKEKNIDIIYDTATISNNDSIIIKNKKILDIPVLENKYIVLRREEF